MFVSSCSYQGARILCVKKMKSKKICEKLRLFTKILTLNLAARMVARSDRPWNVHIVWTFVLVGRFALRIRRKAPAMIARQ